MRHITRHQEWVFSTDSACGPGCDAARDGMPRNNQERVASRRGVADGDTCCDTTEPCFSAKLPR
ncbi:hypothetical protein GCM10027029_15490 [Conyzicola lurida]